MNAISGVSSLQWYEQNDGTAKTKSKNAESVLDELVTSGDITQAQGSAIDNALQSAVSAALTSHRITRSAA